MIMSELRPKEHLQSSVAVDRPGYREGRTDRAVKVSLSIHTINQPLSCTSHAGLHCKPGEQVPAGTECPCPGSHH